MEIDRIFGNQTFEQSGENIVIARLGGEVWIESREIVADAAVENLFAIASFHGGFARRAGGREEGKNGEMEKS